MQRLHGIIGDRRDPEIARLLHQVEHEGGVEILHVPEADLARGRLRAATDRGTDCALSLDRDERLFDGAVLLLDRNRAIVVRAGAPQTLRFRAADRAAALRLGFMAGHLHWRVRFEGRRSSFSSTRPLPTFGRASRRSSPRGRSSRSPMTPDLLLRMLQQGDSAYPSGGFAFSWGLEELAADGWIATAEDVAGFLADLVAGRWAGFDRVALLAAHGAANLDAVATADRAVEVHTLAAAMRAGSKRAGRALLGVQARRLGGEAADYRRLVEADAELGHLPVVQGLVWRLAGLDGETAALLSGWTMAQGIAAAAVRLGLVGHLSAQDILDGARAAITAAAATPTPPISPPSRPSRTSRSPGTAGATPASSPPDPGAPRPMNLTPTELERLTIFNAAEFARRNKRLGIPLSCPEAIALIADEMLLLARQDVPYTEIQERAAKLLTTDDVEPGVAEMIPLISVEGNFAEGTKMIVVFSPVGPGDRPVTGDIPGEIITPDGDLELNAGRARVTIEVVNTGDRDIQVRSHAHFFEANRALRFDRAAAWGMRVDKPSGVGVRFEPGIPKSVELVAIAGARIMRGEAGLVEGPLDEPGARDAALTRARARGYLGA